MLTNERARDGPMPPSTSLTDHATTLSHRGHLKNLANKLIIPTYYNNLVWRHGDRHRVPKPGARPWGRPLLSQPPPPAPPSPRAQTAAKQGPASNFTSSARTSPGPSRDLFFMRFLLNQLPNPR